MANTICYLLFIFRGDNKYLYFDETSLCCVRAVVKVRWKDLCGD